MQMALEASHEVRGVAAVEIAAEETHLDVSIGQGDSDLVFDGGDRLRRDGKSAEASDLDGRPAGLGCGLVQ